MSITKQQWFEFNDYGKECLFDELLAQNADLLAALPDPEKLDILADWLDIDDVVLRRRETGEATVQDDLRKWARLARAAITQVKGETA